MNPPSIDCHVHLREEADIPRLAELSASLPLAGISIVSAPSRERVNDNPLAFLAKSRRPDFFYAFGGLDHSERFSEGRIPAPALAEQVEALADLGADGMKLLETKPTSRRELDVPIDSDYYAGLFARLEERGLPVLWHVADPEEFWDPTLTPGWAAERGWGYDDTFVAKEKLYAEVEAVLARHPGLKVIFPHFYFLSADLDRAAGLLNAHPNVHFDLAPGIELLYNLSKDPARSREFFIEHAERILYGTDVGMLSGASLAESEARSGVVLRFLATSDEFRLPAEADYLLGPPEDGIMRGLSLPDEVLNTICRANFERVVGETPKPLDRGLAAAECRRIAAEVDALAGGKAEDNVAERVAELLER